MKSEKRFEFYSDEELIGVLDTVTGKTFNSFEIVDLLNELNDKNEELNEQVNNYHATFQSLLKTNLSLNNQLAETQKQLNELYKILFPEPDEEHLNCRCSYEPNE